MHSKAWVISLFAVPSISREPTLAMEPRIATSADQSRVVGPASGPESRISPVASTALPGAWPLALITARSCALASTSSRSTVNRAEITPMPTLARAR